MVAGRSPNVPKPEFDPSDALRLDGQLCFAVYAAAHAYNRLYKPLLDRLRLTYPQYLVMLVLWETDGQTVKAIGERLFLDSGTLTPLLKRLEAATLVTRQRDSADERRVLVHLTAAGRALKQEALAVPPAIGAASAANLEEVEALKLSLVELRRRLNAEADRTGA